MQKTVFRRALALPLGALVIIAGSLAPVYAQTQNQTVHSIFPDEMPSTLRSRLFFRMGYVYVKPRTHSGDAYDVTGPVLPRGYLTDVAASSTTDPAIQPGVDYASNLLDIGINRAVAAGEISPNNPGIGTPPGIRSHVRGSGTEYVSLGYYFDDSLNWSLEALLLGAPLTIKAYGEGTNGLGRPNGLSGKEIVDTKLLPPTAIVGYHFFDSKAHWRPFVGVGATYAVFFDEKATQALADYEGGKTSASLKNAFGAGPFVGLQYADASGWSINLNVGQISLRTEATLVTRDTVITSDSPVLADLPKTLFGTIYYTTANRNPNLQTGEQYERIGSGGATVTDIMAAVRAYRASQGGNETFVRKQKIKVDNTLLMLSVGKSF